MEKTKKWPYFLIIIVVILLIIIIYKITKNREEKLYDVLHGKIEYEAKQCFLNQDCDGTITLKDLYDKEYLEIQYDPISKEILNENITIELKDEKITINW